MEGRLKKKKASINNSQEKKVIKKQPNEYCRAKIKTNHKQASREKAKEHPQKALESIAKVQNT
jgi:hypothetical protein